MIKRHIKRDPKVGTKEIIFVVVIHNILVNIESLGFSTS